jgi:Cdc6-like AAA superfamily ATPase
MEDSTVKAKSALSGTNILLMGPAGTGKTHAIGTLVEAGVEVFYLGLEPGLESVLGYFTDKGKEIPANLHWHQIEAPKASFTELMDSAVKINSMALDSLAKMSDPNRNKHNQFIKILEAVNNFPDDRTGEKYGCVDTWTSSRALVVDGMAGLARAAMSLVVGGKPVKNQSDWGIAQDQVEKIVRMWTDNCRCHFVLIAHVERETDAVLGGVKIMISTLGKALGPKLPPMFSDVILTVREGTKFGWDTGSAMADVKTRNLPIAQGLQADFGAIIKKWTSRGGVL